MKTHYAIYFGDLHFLNYLAYMFERYCLAFNYLLIEATDFDASVSPIDAISPFDIQFPHPR